MARRKNETVEAYRARNLAAAKEAYKRDPEKFRKRARDRRAADPVRAQQIDYRHHLKVLYGLTPEAYGLMAFAQGGVCAICKGPPTGPGRRLHVDHDHVSNRVRGLLCSRCNTAIGLLDDDPERVRAVLDYIRRNR